jgi:hypothetical protein
MGEPMPLPSVLDRQQLGQAEQRDAPSVAVATEMIEPEARFRRAGAWRTFPSTRWSLIILVVVYLSMALTYSLLIPAYEGIDEPSHIKVIEYIVGHDALPRIAVANGLESHQPPLYYLLEAGWQHVLGIRSFTPSFVGVKKYEGPNHFLFSTDYTQSQHADAVHVHELRLLSVLFGLATVLLTYAAAKIIGMRESWALASGLFPALWPKAILAASTVTNDALVTPLCALALLLFLLSERAGIQERWSRRRIDLAAMGVVLGAAAITKFNSLIIAAVLFALALVPSLAAVGQANPRTALRRLVDVGLAVVGFFAVSAWWFLRNHHLYGQFLATNASEQYLRAFTLHPIPWNSYLLFSLYPSTVLNNAWYNQPNFIILSLRMEEAMGAAAALCLVVGAWVMLRQRRWVSRSLSPLAGLSLVGCVVAGFIAILIIVKDTSIGDVRDAFGALAAIAIVVTVGSARILTRINSRLEVVGVAFWPVVLLALELYVLIRFLIPLGAL